MFELLAVARGTPFGTKADLEAYRTRVLNPLLKTIPVKTVPYDDIAPICGYNDAEPDDGDCVIA